MSVHVLANPARGRRGSDAADQVAAVVHASGQPVQLHRPATRDAALAAARAAVAAAPDRVVVVGGDGLVHLAVQALAGTRTPLGIVPVGSGNDFARALGLDATGITAAASRALAAPVAIDAIRTTRGWVASVATIGFAAAVNARANRMRWPRGSRRYSLATILELPALRPLPVILELDGRQHHVDATLLAVANTAYFGGGMQICPAASPCDGRLELTVIGPVGRVTLLRVFPRVFAGTHLAHPAVTTFSARHVKLLGASTDAWGDGEPLGALPLELEAVSGALLVAGARPADAS